MTRHRLGTILLWVSSVARVGMIGLSGAHKLIDSGPWALHFTRWGVPTWLIPLVGVAEVVGALLLLIPRTAPIGGLLLAGVMLGAAVTHILNNEPNRILLTLGLMAVATAVAYFRYKRKVAATISV